jgi:uncharacterized coiled-coil DUF342 family protein
MRCDYLQDGTKNAKIAELNEKLSAIREERTKLERESYELAEKRNNLHDRVKSLREEVTTLRNQRDEINDRVAEMKQHRNNLTTEIRLKIDETKKIREEYRVFSKKKPSRSHEDIQKEVESIDWQIQTSSLTVQEDRDLVGKVKQLEQQLMIHRKLEQFSTRIAKVQAEIRIMKSESQQLHLQLTSKAQTSQEIHAKMLQKIDESRTQKTKADELHAEYILAKQKTKTIRESEIALLTDIRSLKMEIDDEVKKEKEQSDSILRETLEKQAKEKLKRGGKLSWEEFQLLAEEGLTEED